MSSRTAASDWRFASCKSPKVRTTKYEIHGEKLTIVEGSLLLEDLALVLEKGNDLGIVVVRSGAGFLFNVIVDVVLYKLGNEKRKMSKRKQSPSFDSVVPFWCLGAWLCLLRLSGVFAPSTIQAPFREVAAKEKRKPLGFFHAQSPGGTS